MTYSKKFIPLVKLGPIWFFQDVKLFHSTKSAHTSDRVVWGSPVNDSPSDVIGYTTILKLPNVGTQCGLVVWFPYSEGSPMLIYSGLQTYRATSICLGDISVMSSDCGTVDDIHCHALTR